MIDSRETSPPFHKDASGKLVAGAAKLMNTTEAENRVKQSKQWRLDMERILQEMRAQQKEENAERGQPGARHLALSITHLEDAKMRLGMRMQDIDAEKPGTAPNPYPESMNPTNARVEPPAA